MSIALQLAIERLIVSWVAMIYLPLVGRRVKVVYRAHTTHVSVVGSLVADSGVSIFVEQHFDQNGRGKTFRLKIPFHCVVRLSEIKIDPGPAFQNEKSSRSAGGFC